MIKKILFLSFYFEPDLCAGSFRNSPLAHELAEQARRKNIQIDVITTLPNRYSTYSTSALEYEEFENLTITRVQIPTHQSGVKDQINSFRSYYSEVKRLVEEKQYNLVYASSSRLFTAYLGYRIASQRKIPLYLDIRDIFVDTIKDVFSNPLIKACVLPIMKTIEKRTFNYASHINLISGGFRTYFSTYRNANFSEYSNGIDPVFLNAKKKIKSTDVWPKLVVYAGNIGEGQGLHKIVPQAARVLGNNFKFRVIGDGGAKLKLIDAVKGLENVELIPPVNREKLIEEYNDADFLFMHLNDYDAFKKVLPSKVFELGVFPKPLIAGVNGYSRKFVTENLPESIIVDPCDGLQLASELKSYKYHQVLDRSEFIDKFKRQIINKKMAESILEYV